MKMICGERTFLAAAVVRHETAQQNYFTKFGGVLFLLESVFMKM